MTAAPIQPTAAADYRDTDRPAADKPQGLWRHAWSRLRRDKTALFSAAVVLLYLLIALVGFTGVLHRPGADGASLITREYGASHAPPRWAAPDTGRVSPALWLGTDFLGRSVLYQFLFGFRIALTVALLASIVDVTIGVTLGALAGYFGGWVDGLVVWLFSTVHSVPWILLMIAFAYALQGQTLFGYSLQGVPSIVLALGLTTWVGLCRLIRGEVIKHRARDYVAAARAIGLGHGRVIFRHILPNVFHLVVVSFCLGLAAFIQAEVILSFLGLGVTGQPSWGRMIDDAKLELLKGVWWQIVPATVAIFAISWAVNLLGDALRDALDPRLRGVG